LELARRITAFNYRHGKVAPRISKMFAIWSSNEEQKKEELLKVEMSVRFECLQD